MKNRKIILAVLCFAFASCSSVRADEDYFSAGVRLYRAQNFSDAYRYLAQAVRLHPQSAAARFYIANTLVRLENHDQAKVEYRACLKLEPYGELAKLSQNALDFYDSPLVIGAPPTPVEPEMTVVKQDNKSIVAKPSGSEDELDKTLAQMKLQAEERKHMQHSIAVEMTRTVQRTEEEKARNIERAAQEDMRSYMELPPASNGQITTDFIQANAQRVRASADKAISEARERARAKENDYQRWCKNQDQLMDTSVSDLTKQMKTNAFRDSAVLDPSTTNLFVRNFVPRHTTEKYPEVHPSVARVHPNQLPPPTYKEANVDKNVSGAVLKSSSH